MSTLRRGDALAVELIGALRAGDLEALGRLLGQHPGLASARIERPNGHSMTPLHEATDWPGQFPNGAAVVAALVAAGADPTARVVGAPHRETPLHWAASCDDVEGAAALIEAGADLEADGASIAGGTPLDDAVGYGQWQVARLLVERGARVEKPWHAAALGSSARLVELLDAAPAPTPDAVNQAFWHACQGGQRRTAELLLARGADPGWVPAYSRGSAVEIAGEADSRREPLVEWLRGLGAGG